MLLSLARVLLRNSSALAMVGKAVRVGKGEGRREDHLELEETVLPLARVSGLWVPDPAARVTRVSLPLPRDFLVTPTPRALATRLTESATAST